MIFVDWKGGGGKKVTLKRGGGVHMIIVLRREFYTVYVQLSVRWSSDKLIIIEGNALMHR